MAFNFRREQLMGGEGRQAGKDFELDLFGLPRVGDPKYRENLINLQREDGYVTFRDAVNLIREIQPTRTSPFAMKLAQKIAEILRENPKFADAVVRFLTAVDTPLDKFHGADAIIEWAPNDKKKRPIQVSLGATMVNEFIKSERQAKKADVEIEASWLKIDDEDGVNNIKIPELARRVIARLEKKAEQAHEVRIQPTTLKNSEEITPMRALKAQPKKSLKKTIIFKRGS